MFTHKHTQGYIYCIGIFLFLSLLNFIYILLFTEKIFEILPSKEIVVEKGGDVTVTCRYNGDCDASLYKKGDPLNPVKKLTRLKIRNNDVEELTWEYVNFQKAYGGVYFCELTNCAQYANNGKTSFEIVVRGKLLKLTIYDYIMREFVCTHTHMSMSICIIFNLSVASSSDLSRARLIIKCCHNC